MAITAQQINAIRSKRSKNNTENKRIDASDIASIRDKRKAREVSQADTSRSMNVMPQSNPARQSLDTQVNTNRMKDYNSSVAKKTEISDIVKRPDYSEKSKSVSKEPSFWYKTMNNSPLDVGPIATAFDREEAGVNSIDELERTHKKSLLSLDKNFEMARAYADMSDTDKGVYNYIFNTDGKTKADEYLDDLLKNFNSDVAVKQSQEMKNFTQKHPVLGSAASVAATLAKPAGLAYTIDQSLNGKEIDPNSPSFYGSNAQSTIRNTVKQDNDFGKVGGFLYDTGMSTLDSLLASAMGPTGGALTLATGAGSDTAQQVKQNGGSDKQAVLSAITSSIAEGLFERVSLGNLKSLKEVPINSIKDVARNTLKSIGVNASEEAATELSNIVANYFIMGDLSDYTTSYNSYLQQGYSEDEASNKASVDMAKRIGLSAAAGALSGGGMSAVGQTSNYISGASQGSKINKQGMTDTYIEAGKNMEPDTDIYNIALEMEKQKQQDKKPSNYQIGNLARSIDRVSNNNVSQRYTDARQQADTETDNMETMSENKNIDIVEQTSNTPMPNAEMVERSDTRTNSQLKQAKEETPQTENNVPMVDNALESQNTKPVEKVTNIEAKWNDIEGATVKGIAKVENGKVMVTIESGGQTITDKVENVTFDNPAVAEVYTASAEYQTNGAKAFTSNYDGKVSLPVYKKAFNAYYDAGLINMSINQVNSYYGAYIPQAIRLNAYGSGINDAKAQNETTKTAQEQTSTKKEVKNVKSGVVNTEASKKMDATVRDGLDALGKAAGVPIRIEETLAGGQANGIYKDGTLYIALDSDNPYMVVAKHELTHGIQQFSPEKYKTYKDFVIKEINKSNPQAYNDMVDNLIDRYEEIGQTLTRAEAMDEIVADASEMFLMDPDVIERLAEQDRSLAEKIVEIIRDLIDKIQSIISSLEPKSKAAIALNENLESAKKAEELWIEALSDVSKSKVKAETNNKQFSLKDSDGRKLSEKQQEYFNESKVRDSKGNLQVMYHGTPNAVFTTFKNYSYFTPDKEYANRYTQKSTQQMENPSVYSVYLNIVNPFDITNSKSLRLYKRFIMEGNSAYIDPNKSEAEINSMIKSNGIDWSEADNLIEYFEENGYDYDGLIVKERPGIDGYVAFNPNQVKNVDNLSPTDNSDIRYQLKDVDKVEYNRVLEENEKLREANELLQEQFAITKEMKPRKADIEKVSRNILKQYNSEYDLSTMVENLTSLWDFIQNSDYVDGGEVAAVTSEMAKQIIEKSRAKNTYMQEQYSDLKSKLKNTGLTLSDKDKGDLASLGGYNRFRKDTFGKIKLVTDGIKVDVFYQELQGMYPDLFPEEYTHPAEQLTILSEVADLLKPTYENPYGMSMDEAASTLAYEIYDAYFDIARTSPTFADKKKKELEKTKALYKKRIYEVKQEYKAKYTERYKKAVADTKTKLKDTTVLKLKAQQIRYDERMLNYKKKKTAQSDMNKWKSGIKKIAKDLSNMLIRPNEKKHIPGGLRSSIINVCQILNFDTGITGPNGEPTQVTVRLERLKAAYSLLAKDDEGSLNSFYSEDIEADLIELTKAVEGKRINQLGYEDLQKVYNIMKHLRFIVNQENKMFNSQIKETVTVTGENTISYLNKAKKFNQLSVVANNRPIKAFSDMLNKGNIKPYYFFKQIGGELERLYKNIRDGEDTFVENFKKGNEFAHRIEKKYDYASWSGKNDEAEEFKTTLGKKISLTTEEKLYIYMAYKREQGKNHILNGGVVANEPKVVTEKKDRVISVKKVIAQSEPVKFSEIDIVRLSDTLTDEQKGFAEEMSEYLTTELSMLGNEVSNQMYGYDTFTEKNYIPLTSDSNFLFSKAGVTDDKRIKRSGFTKSIVPKASNPIIATNFMEVWSKHLVDMSMYNSLVLPIEDFQRVWNYKQPTKTGENLSVKTAIQSAYGSRANDYIKNLLNDINGGIKADIGGELSNLLLSKMKIDAVMGNMSVAIQQPSSLARAFVVIDPKYFIKTTFNKRDYQELLKYSPQATLKQYGYFDVNMGRSLSDVIIQPEYDTPVEKIKAFFTDKNVRNEVFSWLPQKMDELTWSHIWNAVKEETKSETKIKENTPEFFEHVKERFKEVIDRSQVMDSVFQRSEMMRSTNSFAKIATNFMAEPTVNYNMLFDAINEYKKKGKSASPYVVRSIASVASAMVLNSLLKSIITAARDKDEDKEYGEKYIENFVKNISDDPLSMVPYVNSVFSVFKGYDAVRPDMQVIQNFYYAYTKLDSDKYTTAQKSLQMAQAIAPFVNVPLKNITRDIEMIYRNGSDALESLGVLEGMKDYDKLKVKYDISKLDNTKASGAYYDLLYQAQLNGDKALYKQVYDDLINSGRKPSSIESAMTSRTKEGLMNRKKDEEYTDPLVVKALDALENKDVNAYKSAREQLVKKGYSLKIVDSVIDSLKSERAKAKAPTTQEWVKAYKSGNKNIWLPIFNKMREAGWSQQDLLGLVK